MNEQQRNEARHAGHTDNSTNIGSGAIHATQGVLHDAIAATEEVGSELVGGVSHLASDIVHGVRDVGVEVGQGANGLIHVVGDVGNTAVSALTHLLVDVVGGVRQVMGAAVGRQASILSDENADTDLPPTPRTGRQHAASPPPN
jgi:hypothetical protein